MGIASLPAMSTETTELNGETVPAALGQVITFYSYKGGAGRSMALVNTACLLARGGAGRVLLVDWDLEAPGLHHYFSKQASGGGAKQGLLELLSAASERVMAPSLASRPDADSIWGSLWKELDVESEFIGPTGVDGIEYMRAGRFSADYGDRLSELDWKGLFHRCPELFSALAHRLATEFKWVLVDARTGTTDTTGVCTMQIPDKLVIVFTPNRQSLEGVAALTRRAVDWRTRYGDSRPFLVYPLPSRIDSVYDTLRKKWRYGEESEGVFGYQPLFEQALSLAYDLANCSLETYFDEVQVQHAPEFAYGERIAALEPQDGIGEDRFSMLRSYEALLDWLVEGIPPWEERERYRATAELIKLYDRLDVVLAAPAASEEESKAEVVRLRSRGLELAIAVHGSESSEAMVALFCLAAAQAAFIGAEEALGTLARHSFSAADTDVSALQAMSELAKALLLAGQPAQALSWVERAYSGIRKLLEPKDPRSVAAASAWFSILAMVSDKESRARSAAVQQRLLPSISYPSRAYGHRESIGKDLAHYLLMPDGERDPAIDAQALVSSLRDGEGSDS
jgi:MinD-like ATPase involved in chromosome partitioning or flagellar assembly